MKQTPEQILKKAARIADTALLIHRRDIIPYQCGEDRLSPFQINLLAVLAEEGVLTMTPIAKKMGHSTAAATGLIDRLQKLGYVQRLHASDDRRKVMVQITRKGVDVVDGLRGHVVAQVAELLHEQAIDADDGV
jgi:DNA-binding MarR family transcriptional regulator